MFFERGIEAPFMTMTIWEKRRQPCRAGGARGDLLARDDPARLAVRVVVRVPRIVAVVVVALDVSDALAVRPVHHAGAEAHDRIRLELVAPAAHPDHVAELQPRHGDLDGVQVRSEALLFGHALVEDLEHLVEAVFGLLSGFGVRDHADRVEVLVVVGREPLDDSPAVDDVDAVVAWIHPPVGRVRADADAKRAAEEVAEHLAQPGPAVRVGAGRAEALQLAVLEERLDRVAPSVPVHV